MCDVALIDFRSYYEQLYADKHSSLSTAEEARAIISAFVDYRRALNLPCRPMSTPQGVKLLCRLLYHKRAMQAAEASQQTACADQHWKAVLELWNRYLYAVYVDEACYPARKPSLALYQRVRLWWRRAHNSPVSPLPRRAWAMVCAVDLLREQLTIGN